MIFTKFIVKKAKKVAKAKTRQRYTRSKHVVIQIQANQREQVSKWKKHTNTDKGMNFEICGKFVLIPSL